MIKVDENGIICVTEVSADVVIEVERDAKQQSKNVDYERNRENAPKFKVMLSNACMIKWIKCLKFHLISGQQSSWKYQENCR